MQLLKNATLQIYKITIIILYMKNWVALLGHRIYLAKAITNNIIYLQTLQLRLTKYYDIEHKNNILVTIIYII